MRTRSIVLAVAGVTLHCLFLVSLFTGWLNPLFDDATHRAGQAADFYGVYQAGVNCRSGESVYKMTVPAPGVPYYYIYRYHPFTACTIGRVLTLLTPHTAYVFWIALQEILLALNLWLTWRWFGDRPERRAGAIFLWLAFTPFYLELYMGQFSFLMASLTFWAVLFWLTGKPWSAGISWIISLLLKSNSALLAPVLLRERRFRLLALAGIAALAASLPYFLTVPGSWDAFFWNVREPLAAPAISGNQGLPAAVAAAILKLGGFWRADAPPDWHRLDAVIRVPLLALTVLAVSTSLLATLRARADQIGLLFGLWILTYFLIYKHVWEHHYVMALPALLLLYRENFSPKIFRPAFAVIALPSLFYFIDQPSGRIDPELVWTPAQSLLFHLPKVVAILILYLAVLRKLVSAKPSVVFQK